MLLFCRRTAVHFHERQTGLRGHLAFRAWRRHTADKRLRLQRLARAQEVGGCFAMQLLGSFVGWRTS